jgi:hypothetical protein
LQQITIISNEVNVVLETVFFFIGIGILLGFAWIVIRFGPALLALAIITLFDVLAIWVKAFRSGWNDAGKNKIGASGKSRREL